LPHELDARIAAGGAGGGCVSIMFHPLKAPAGTDVPMGGILMEVERGDGEVLKVNRPARLGGP
jgi:hypothetical protein